MDKNPKLKIVFLGGVGEIGKNMTALEYENDIIIIDSGLAFPDDSMPGIDLVVPDITYLLQNKEKIRGIVLTHGHEDHIGGLPFVLNEIDTAIYGSKLTVALCENKLREYPKIKYKANVIKARSVIKLGCFSVEFIPVNHSIAGSMALAITTPVGMVVHTGDFKIDYTPIQGENFDMHRLAEIGKRGVQLLLCESTNVERKGFSMSEATVGKALESLFENYSTKRLFVATFASNIHRLQQILDLAVKYKRKVAFSGRSMINVSETALKCGELHVDHSIFIDIDKVNRYADHEVLIVTTGSQGEPMSALTRMSNDEFGKVKLGPNDCVILSSSPIPGNEKSVYRIINKLYQKGCEVIYHELAEVHVSGHAYQEELKTMHALIKPKFFIPVHGEFRHLKLHSNLAIAMGTEERNIILPEIGNVVELTKNTLSLSKNIQAGERFVDGTGFGDAESNVIRDRKTMSAEGVCIAVVTLKGGTYSLVKQPDIITRGFIYNDEANEVITEARTLLLSTINKSDLKDLEKQEFKMFVRKLLTNFFMKKVKRKPMILTIIQEI